MSCGGGHLGFPIDIKNVNFVEDLPMIIPGQFGFNCPSGFRGEDFKTFFLIGSYVKTMFADGCHLGWRSGSQDIIWKVDHLRTIHPMFALN